MNMVGMETVKVTDMLYHSMYVILHPHMSLEISKAVNIMINYGKGGNFMES